MKFQGPKTAIASLASFLAILTFPGCAGGSSGNPANSGPFTVSLISTGQGQIFPYRIRQLAAGLPTSNIVNIDSDADLMSNVAANNSVLPVASFPQAAILPDGSPGNHFVLMRFTHELDPESILSSLLADSVVNSGLTTAVSLVAENQNTESSTILRGRGFVGGFTFVNRGGSFDFIQAVSADEDGNVSILEPEGQGFPTGFSGDEDLVAANSFVFVADTDDSLLPPFETFDPAAENILVSISVSAAVRDTDGAVLEQELCTATTVGPDMSPPNVVGFSSNRALELEPTMGSSVATDPETQFVVRFTKPVQPRELGSFFDPNNLTPTAGGVRISLTQQVNTFDVAYYADPFSFADFCNYRITPAYTLPDNTAGTVSVTASSITGLQGPPVEFNQQIPISTTLGPGIVNAPVAPDVVYLGIGGSNPGLAAIDLNGFGQGTSSADPLTSSFTQANPNVGVAGVIPTLQPGTSGLDAGSKGFLTLVENSRGNTVLLGAPTLGQVGDIHIGMPLDLVFNNSNINLFASAANQSNPVTGVIQPGCSMAQAPTPNPPKLVYPPPNLSRRIFGEEPSVNSSQGPPGAITTGSPPCVSVPPNRLTSGQVLEYFPRQVEGIYTGPQPPPGSPPPPLNFCPFTSRQQIGHFLYVLDQENDQILVVNSNRFTVLDTIRLTDPFSMAFSPTLAQMAVTNFSSSTVTIIDTDPRSGTFNQVVAETRVADGPTAIAWQPDGEAVLAVSTTSNILTVLRAGDFSIQTEVSGGINAPLEIAVTPRYLAHGNISAIYYAYILNSNGSIVVYESGPNGTNGVGFDNVIGDVGRTFARATNIRFDPQSALGGVYVTHVDPGGLGQVSRLELTTTPFGPQPVNQVTGTGFILPPTFRNKEWTVTRRFGGFQPENPSSALLSGNSPVDVAFDEFNNFAAFPNQVTLFAQGQGRSVLGHSAKGAVIVNAGGGIQAPTIPRFLFIAVGDVGRVDIFDIETSARVSSIPVPGVTTTATYYRQ